MPRSLPHSVHQIHEHLVQLYSSLENFTKDEFVAAIIDRSNIDTYWSKKIAPLLIRLENRRYRVSEYFRRYLNYNDFAKHWSQTAQHVASYVPNSRQYMSFQFFLPLANELILLDSLDAMFYEDRLRRKLSAVDQRELEKYYKRGSSEQESDYINRVTREVAVIFGGYSVFHVSGRFRADAIMTFEEASKMIQSSGSKYLFDETTAVIRFIVPLSSNNEESQQLQQEMRRTRWIFMKTFVQTILESVNGEAEIWLMESGAHNQLYSWSRIDD